MHQHDVQQVAHWNHTYKLEKNPAAHHVLKSGSTVCCKECKTQPVFHCSAYSFHRLVPWLEFLNECQHDLKTVCPSQCGPHSVSPHPLLDIIEWLVQVHPYTVDISITRSVSSQPSPSHLETLSAVNLLVLSWRRGWDGMEYIADEVKGHRGVEGGEEEGKKGRGAGTVEGDSFIRGSWESGDSLLQSRELLRILHPVQQFTFKFYTHHWVSGSAHTHMTWISPTLLGLWLWRSQTDILRRIFWPKMSRM